MSVAETQSSRPPTRGALASAGGRYGTPIRLSRDPWFLGALLWILTVAVAYTRLEGEAGLWMTYFAAPAALLGLVVAVTLRAAATTRRTPEKRFWRLLAGSFSLWWSAVVFASPLGSTDAASVLFADVAYGGFYALLIVAVETRPHRRLEASTGPLEHRLMAPAAGFFVGGWLVYFSVVTVALGLREEESVLPSLLLFSLLDLYLAGRLVQLAARSAGGWRSIYLWLAGAAAGFLATDLFAALELALGFGWRWDRWPNALWLVPLVAVVAAARLARAGPRSASTAPQMPIVRPLPTVLWVLSFPVLHAALEWTGWLAPGGHQTRELVVVAMVAILGAYAVIQRQLLVRHSLELWRQGRRVERELKESEQDLLLMVARGHQRQALERHEQTYQKAFQASPDALVLTTWAEGRVLEANQSFLDMIGSSRDEVIGRVTAELPLWRDPEIRRRTLDRVMAEGAVHFAEIILRGADGERQRAALSLDRVETADGRLLLAVFRRLDVLQPADGVGVCKAGWAAALESASEGVLAVDGQGHVTLANEAAARRLNRPLDALREGAWSASEDDALRAGATRFEADGGGFLVLLPGHDG